MEANPSSYDPRNAPSHESRVLHSVHLRRSAMVRMGPTISREIQLKSILSLWFKYLDFVTQLSLRAGPTPPPPRPKLPEFRIANRWCARCKTPSTYSPLTYSPTHSELLHPLAGPLPNHRRYPARCDSTPNRLSYKGLRPHTGPRIGSPIRARYLYEWL